MTEHAVSPDDEFLGGNAKKNADIAKEQERQRRRLVEHVRRLLKNDPGFGQFVWWFWGKAGLFRTSFTPNANQTAFFEGRREIGLTLLEIVNEADPGAFAKLQRDYISEQNSKGDSNARP